jgi:O-acetyl-ADP-ribose deacetylase (regulator of RNase III)
MSKFEEEDEEAKYPMPPTEVKYPADIDQLMEFSLRNVIFKDSSDIKRKMILTEVPPNQIKVDAMVYIDYADKEEQDDSDNISLAITEVENEPFSNLFTISVQSNLIENNNYEAIVDIYLTCLQQANEYGLKSIVFPCLGCQEPNYSDFLAAKAILPAVYHHLKEGSSSSIKTVIFTFSSDSQKFYFCLEVSNLLSEDLTTSLTSRGK